MKKIIFSAFALPLLMAACNNSAKTDDTSIKDEGTNTTAESKQERNKKAVMAAMDNFSKRDFDGVLQYIDPNFIDYADGSVQPITNKDTLRNLFTLLTTTIEDYKPANLKYYADGDYVLVEGEWMGVFKKDIMGIKATGKPIKFKDVDIFKMTDDGKIKEHNSIQSLGAVLTLAGMQK